MDSVQYDLVLSDKFNSSLEQLLKAHYRRDKKAYRAFIDLLENFKKEVVENFEIGAPMPFPCRDPINNCQLRKQRWQKLPGLSGGSKRGRLIYLVDTERKIITFVWIYTHEEFKTQPPDRELHKVITSAST